MSVIKLPENRLSILFCTLNYMKLSQTPTPPCILEFRPRYANSQKFSAGHAEFLGNFCFRTLLFPQFCQLSALFRRSACLSWPKYALQTTVPIAFNTAAVSNVSFKAHPSNGGTKLTTKPKLRLFEKQKLARNVAGNLQRF